MGKKRTYAVVDLETTGTHAEEDRIIQFGCSFIENGKIIQSFATDIQPNQKVPETIASLTGLTDKRLRKAPQFEEVAATIYALLQDTIFVAHNVNFDYHFLNRAFERIGWPELEIPAVDTVELAQILYPSMSSYRLKDLAQSFGFVHDNPHQADSDAWVTAKLLLAMGEKLRKIPIPTLEQLVKNAALCTMETASFIQEQLTFAQKHPNEQTAYYQVGTLVMRKPKVSEEETDFTAVEYPKGVTAKAECFSAQLETRPSQSQMMDDIDDYLTKKPAKSGPFLIEAPTGIGKSLGYLYPLSFKASTRQPVVISTSTTILQDQLATKELPRVRHMQSRPFDWVVVKGTQHYIDLARLAKSLQTAPIQKQQALFQMRVLVWLLETETGDLDEVNRENLQHPFWQEIAHQGIPQVHSSIYYQATVDFLARRNQAMSTSAFIIVNHAWLINETQQNFPHLPKRWTLVLDEAHRLPDIIRAAGNQEVRMGQINQLMAKIIEQETGFREIIQTHQMRAMHQPLNQWIGLAKKIQKTIFLIKELGSTQADETVMLSPSLPIYSQLSKYGHLLTTTFEQFDEKTQTLHKGYRAYQEAFTRSQGELVGQLDRYRQQVNSWQAFFKEFFVLKENCASWIQRDTDKNYWQFVFQNYWETPIWPQKLCEAFEKVILTTGTAFYNQERIVLVEELDIQPARVQRYASEFDYRKQLQFYLPSEAKAVNQLSTEELTSYIAEMIIKATATISGSVLVLFTSHEVLTKVYYRIHGHFLEQSRECLAQSISGTKDKIRRRFQMEQNAILLGTDSFWEGLDFAKEGLELMIMTRLPFDPPNRPYAHAKEKWYQQQGRSYFEEEALPKAAFRLRQGVGRLIRSRTDKGVFILLDNRLETARYGSVLQQALPADLEIKHAPLMEIAAAIPQFFATDFT